MSDILPCAMCPLKQHNCGEVIHNVWDCPKFDDHTAVWDAWATFLSFFKVDNERTDV